MGIPIEKETKTLDSKLSEKINFKLEKDKAPNVVSEEIYKLPFEHALNLIPTMQYFLHKGFIYVSKNELPGLVENVFKDLILKKLMNFNKNIDRLMSDSRIAKIVKMIELKREGKLNL